VSTADFRYTVGVFQFGLPVSADERSLYLSQVADAPSKVRAAVEQLSDARLDTPYRPGGWTVRQVVHHLADAHLNWYIRAKLALTEGEPTMKPSMKICGLRFGMDALAPSSRRSRSSKASMLAQFYSLNC
jgi:Mycothiol maleylpyruvate isomerase N-terminal domain